MKLLFALLLLLSSYTVFAQEYVKVFDDKDMDYYANPQCEIDEQGNYLLWTKQVIKPERLQALRNRLMIETQSNNFMSFSHVVQLLRFDFEHQKYCVASVEYLSSDGTVLYEEDSPFDWMAIQSESQADKYYQVAKRYVKEHPIKPAKTEYSGKIYEVVEQMPSFPGGYLAMVNYIRNNVTYPTNVPVGTPKLGSVEVKFIVERDGSISHAQVARSLDPILDKEALRVINNMPKWNPGKHNGQPVRVSYKVPVSFRAQ